jgi:hypothetical protein
MKSITLFDRVALIIDQVERQKVLTREEGRTNLEKEFQLQVRNGNLVIKEYLVDRLANYFRDLAIRRDIPLKSFEGILPFAWRRRTMIKQAQKLDRMLIEITCGWTDLSWFFEQGYDVPCHCHCGAH